MKHGLLVLVVSCCAFAQQTEQEFTDLRLKRILPLVNSEKYAEAVAGLRDLIAKARERIPADSIETARLLSVFVDCLLRLGQGASDEAMEASKTALAIKQKHLPPNSAELLNSWTRVAARYVDRYEFETAVPILERAVAALEAAAEPSSRGLFDAVTELASVHYNSGAYAKCLAVAERGLAIAERNFGVDSLEAAQSLTQIGFAAQGLGDSFTSGVALERCLRIREKLLGPDKRLTIAALNNLGSHYQNIGQNTKAIELFERANAARARLLGPNHPDNAIGIHNLAVALQNSGNYRGAREQLNRALEIRERTIGTEHYLYGLTCIVLSDVLLRSGELAEARERAEHAVLVMSKRVGPEHPMAIWARHTLAAILERQGDYAAAFRNAKEASESWIAMMRLSAQSTSERGALQIRESWRDRGPILATALAANAGGAERREAMDLWIRSRSMVLDEVAFRQKVLNRASTPEIEALRTTMLQTRGRVARIALNGGSGLMLAKQARDRAERAYAEKSRDARFALRRAAIGFDDVARSLRPGEVLVAYAQSKAEVEAEKRLVAFVLHEGATEPLLVRLGKMSETDRAVNRWRGAIAEAAQDPARAGVRAEASIRDAGLALRKLVYDPVAAQFGKAKRVYLVADGTLQLINFLALPVGPGRYLIDDGPLLHVLPAERDIVAVEEKRARNSGLLAMGNPDFASSSRVTTASRGARCGGLQAMSFPPLPGTVGEVGELASIWTEGKPEVVQGAQATEAAFRQRAPGKRVVHLATHGYFLGDDCVRSVEPLVGSGVVLSAEKSPARAAGSVDDGILTAEEVAGFNLDGVEWVVLSGCDTGLGQVSGGDGVYGLRRAFQAAGASTVIMSLWPVEDRAAQLWMRTLYAARFKRGLSTPESLRSAGRSILAARRKAGLSTHPYFWAAFVGTGNK